MKAKYKLIIDIIEAGFLMDCAHYLIQERKKFLWISYWKTVEVFENNEYWKATIRVNFLNSTTSCQAT